MSTTAPASKFERFVSKYREDHRHPVNHVLHVYVGWPLCALGVVLLPVSFWWTIGLFALGYVFMWTGHFLFEKNLPTIFKNPATPFLMAWAVIRGLAAGASRLVSPRPGRTG
jgi:hypothetical protein